MFNMVIVTLTAINNWAIPLAIYVAKFGLLQKRPEGFVGCNCWGVVMDVILAGAINLALWNYYVSMHVGLNSDDLARALMFGLAAMVVTHVFMAATYWREWIMPEPWHWNLGGYWHMVSETVQMTYVFYFPLSLAHKPVLLNQPATWGTFLLLIVFGLLFLWALSVKDEGIKVGWLEIGGEPW